MKRGITRGSGFGALPRSVVGVTFSVVFLGLASHTSAAVIYQAGPNIGDTPQEYSLGVDWPDGPPGNPGGLFFYSRSDASGLYSQLGLRNTNRDNFFTYFEVDDVIVSSQIPGAGTAEVTFGGRFTGSISGSGGGAAILNIGINDGSGWLVRGLNFNTTGASIDQLFTVSRLVPVGREIGVYATLELRGAGGPSNLLLDFARSFEWDPNQVFGVDAGFTANSASWGLVDNQLPAAFVPVPAALPLLGSALLGLGFITRRRQKAA